MQKSLMINSKIIYLSFALTALAFSPALAETATQEEMSRVSRNWLSYMIFQRGEWSASQTPMIGDIQDIIVNDTLLGRRFAVEPNGYIVVPNLKELAPIKAYSEDYRLDFNDPDGFSAMLKEVLQDRIRLYVNAYGSMEVAQPAKGDVLYGPEQRAHWDRFLMAPEAFDLDLKTNKSKLLDQVGPLLTTSWHQGAPYNNKCPMGDGGRTVVGCVATAASQIMAFHKWPLEGTGTKSYYWPGDNSCGGGSPGGNLTADFATPYDWDNMPNICSPGCNTAQQNALSELCYEVGVAFTMSYGRCGSGAYTSDAQWVFPTFFRYYNNIQRHDRTSYSLVTWSDLIWAEVTAGRPIQYRISSHSIVADGWRYTEPLFQVHMNYGWNDGHTAWYTIDNLYCNWSGCSSLVEYMLTNIAPDRGVQFTADTTWGFGQLDVQFTGSSSLLVDQWIWDFGDGDSEFVQSPQHLYDSAGLFSVRLSIISGSDTGEYYAANYITVLNDSLIGLDSKGKPDSSFAIEIYGRNTLPLRKFQIPLHYGGPLNLIFDSISTVGCRTDYFDTSIVAHFDPANYRAAVFVYNTGIGMPDLDPGYGPILKVYFTIPSSSPLDSSNAVTFDPYMTYSPIFFTSLLDYSPILESGSISVAYVCGDADGNNVVNALDITYLINYLYKHADAPNPVKSGNANGIGDVNILDITFLINYLYKHGPAPICP